MTDSHPISIVAAGVVTGLLSAFFALSYTSLIFGGEMAQLSPMALGYFLQGALIVGLVTALFSSLPGTIATVQDVPAAMYAVVSAAIVTRMAERATPDQIFATVVMGLVLTSAVVGLGFWALGTARLGNLVSYVPYPVTAGFLAGVGIYLIVGAVQISTGVPVTWANATRFATLDMASMWLPTIICGLTLFWLMQRFHNPFVLPGFLAALIVAFQIWIWIAGLPAGDASRSFSGLPPSPLWQLPNAGMLALVDWQVLLSKVGGIGSILVVSSLSMLMNVGGLSMEQSDDIDFNRELKVSGSANLLLSLTASLPGYMSISLTSLTQRMGARSRLSGVVLAITCAAILTLGGEVLGLVPIVAVAGLLFFLGASFLNDWLFTSWGKLSRTEFAVVLLICTSMQVFGALIGVGIGLMLSVALFVVTYSRFNVVRSAASGAQRRSNVERPPRADLQLSNRGDQIHILTLDGFIFFGTGNLLIKQIRARIDDDSRLPIQYLLLDCRRVIGIDASAAQTFVQLQKLSERQLFALVFTNMSPAVSDRIKGAIQANVDFPTSFIFEDTDRGLEWCEEQLLISAGDDPRAMSTEGFRKQLWHSIDNEIDGQDRLLEYTELREYDAGDILIEHDTRPSGICLIASGEVSVLLNYENGRTLRIRRAGPGTIFGEMSFYSGRTATASVVADVPSTVHFLSLAELKRMEQEMPDLAAAFHKFSAQILSLRLSQATSQLHQLQE